MELPCTRSRPDPTTVLPRAVLQPDTRCHPGGRGSVRALYLAGCTAPCAEGRLTTANAGYMWADLRLRSQRFVSVRGRGVRVAGFDLGAACCRR